MINQKSEVLEKFKDYVNLVENQTGSKVKGLRSDNGGEYMSKDFDQFCNDRGIQREPTIPYSPQQNGVAERMNRTLMETARSMLYHADKSLSF
jgi:transposase InsO family protein